MSDATRVWRDGKTEMQLSCPSGHKKGSCTDERLKFCCAFDISMATAKQYCSSTDVEFQKLLTSKMSVFELLISYGLEEKQSRPSFSEMIT